MSNFNFSVAEGDRADSNGGIESLLAQLRQQSGPDLPAQDQPSQSFNSSRSFFGQPSPDASQLLNTFQRSSASPGLPPAAPSPPGHSAPSSQYPPAVMSQAAAPRAKDERTANLLNLLKFSDHGSSPPSSQMPQQRDLSQSFSSPLAQPQGVLHAPAPSSADPTGLLAALMKGNLHTEAPKPEQPAPQAWASNISSSDTQQYLLNLLNRPKPSQNEALGSEKTHSATLTPPSTTDHSRESHKLSMGNTASTSSDATVLPPVPSRHSFDFEPKSFGGKSPSFPRSPAAQPETTSDVGRSPSLRPLDDAPAAPPHQRSPGHPAASSIRILKKADVAHQSDGNKRSSSARSPESTPDPLRRKIASSQSSAHPAVEDLPEKQATPALIDFSDTPKQSVSDALHDLAAKANEDAQAALVRRERQEEEQAEAEGEIAKDLEEMMHARTDEEFEESARAAAQAIKRELDREENRDALESTLRPEVAQAVHEIVDEAANGGPGVADSWESAEADEIIVIEEAASGVVKVYNFPMKPWISMTLQPEADMERPMFRDESIVDIARLKKEFDQMDRNLVTATETFIAYGMSKAGGLRIIRQDDGKDSKVFTDTKDRIFNVAMSSNTADLSSTSKEAIIGTGTSGSVYWVQIKNGRQDILDEAQTEQHSFVLPPLSAHEGEAPGGVLKTRARTSSTHPDFFAVGRGKTINVIWPSFVLQHRIIKPGPSRIVDTDQLSKQCSLRINTGKAGKDFTFSQDDTTIVSLDKSGRVKFWDVRDLTTAAENSALPQRTSLEVKEPLMTLTTTPEGEKAWPTSVLLLDKQRPYQKRTALRYMIVGLKQNHTLQLWDLALGKPVQEFNLPHSKESDAACSVLYHPPTGIIVVGHPTRNSIYFLHLSAPKYTLKSLSQVDYVQRLVAQDSSIPTPESTAVISGMREYSFENRGVLRSLDILENPVNSPPSGDGQALFELYAMHSKGVTCMVIRQGDLGWTKDNKVEDPVDAVVAGVVKIEKLPQTAQPEPPAAVDPSRIKLALRSKDKDTLQKSPSSQGEDTKGVESATNTKPAQESKDSEDASHHTKEKKASRKKKASAAATAAAAAATSVERELTSNGTTAVAPVPSALKAEPRVASSSAVEPPAYSPFTPGVVESILDQHLTSMEGRLAENINSHVASTIDGLDRSFDKKLKGREMSFETRQAKLLEMVSEVLNENTQKVLTSIVRDQFEKSAMPVIRDTIAQSVSDQLSTRVGQSISHALQKELHKLLPNAVSQSFGRPEIAKSISDRVVTTVLDQVEDELIKAMNSQMIPAFTQLAAQAAQRVGNDVIRQVNDDLARVDQHRHADNSRMDQLIALNTKLSHTVSSIASSQAQLQNEIMNLKQTLREHERERGSERGLNLLGHGQAAGTLGSSPAAVSQHSLSRYGAGPSMAQESPHFPSQYGSLAHSGAESQPLLSRPLQAAAKTSNDEAVTLEQLIDVVGTQMRNHNYNDAIVTWLRNDDKSEAVFKAVLVSYNPQFISELPPIILLSMVSMLTKNLLDGEYLTHKLAWTELLLISYGEIVHSLDSEVRSVTPKIMSLLKSRLEQLFLNISNMAPRDPVLKNITNMTNMATRIIDTVRPGVVNPHSPY